MGLLNKLREKAQDALGQGQSVFNGDQNQPPGRAAAEASAAESTLPPQPAGSSLSPEPAADQVAAFAGPGFEWDGERYPMPEGWDELSMEDWFFKRETIHEEMHHAPQADLPTMTDEDGDELEPAMVLLISKYGFESGTHWEAFSNWGLCKWAREAGEGPSELGERMFHHARARLTSQRAENMAFGELAPVDGVSVEAWARMQAALAQGADLQGLLVNAGIDQPTWERVSAEWIKRMESDTSMTIATVYGQAFSAG